MDSCIFPEYLKVGPLRLPKVLWNIIKEYMPYCHQCYINIDKIRKCFPINNEIVFKSCNIIHNVMFGYDEIHTITHTLSNMIKWEQVNYAGHIKTYDLCMDEFAIYLAHSCDIEQTNVKYNHFEPLLFGHSRWTQTGYEYYNSEKIRDVILYFINKN